MIPVVYLNPPPSSFPLVELNEEQNFHLYLSPTPQPAASSLSASTNFFNSTVTHQDQRVLSTKLDEPQPHDHYTVKNKLMSTHEGSSDHMQQASSSSSLAMQDQSAASGGHNLSFGIKDEDHGDYDSASDNGSTVKWMPSKMRIMKRMMNNLNCGSSTTGSPDNNNKSPLKFELHQYPRHDSDENSSFGKIGNNTVRVCSACNTTTTPLWRSGPRGPKSLCNACGIRQRKARRAMEAAAAAGATANGAAVATDTTSSTTTSMKIKLNINKEKKARTRHVAPYKKQSSSPQSQKKLICFKEFALNFSKNSALQRAFPQDVEDAAILLMELSCGLVHS